MNESRLVLRNSATGEDIVVAGIMPVGRHAAVGINLAADGASRRHAELSVVDGKVYVQDLGSLNGTWINGTRVTAKTLLKAGDRIKFDTEEFEFQPRQDAATVQHAPPPVTAPPASQKNPGSWAEVRYDDSDRTLQLSSEQLQAYLANAKQRRQHQTQFEAREPCLRIQTGSRAGFVFPLSAASGTSQEWTIGRNPDSSLPLDETGISDCHAKIVREGERWKVLDAFSVNGSFVNGLQVGMGYLTSGDTVRFGPVECIFNLPRKSASVDTTKVGGRRNWLLGTAAMILGLAALVVIYIVLHEGVW